MIGESARRAQERLERGEDKQVGVTVHRQADDPGERPPPQARPDPARLDAYLARLDAFKAARDQAAVQATLDALARACSRPDDNIHGRVVAATLADATHGEICATVRNELGTGEPLVVA